jgi:flagellar basal body-associated protein FliL
MKKKGIIIGIISIIVVTSVVLLVVLLPNKNNDKKEENNTPKVELKSKRTFEGFEFTDATVQEENSKYAFIANVTAKEQKDTFTRVIITYYDENNKELGAAICALPRANIGEMKSFSCTTDNKEILNAVDYKVVKSDKEIGE